MLQNFFVLKSATSVIRSGFVPDCTNNAGQIEAATLHSITDLKYAQYIRYQYGTAAPVETTFSRTVIMAAINTPIGGNPPTYLEFAWNTSTHVVTITAKTGEPTDDSYSVDYSCCLFKGIDLLDNQPDSFVFVKALDKNGDDTLVFKSIKNLNPVHFYDVSSDHP